MQMPLRCPSPFRRTATRSPSATMKHRPTRPTTSCSRSPRRATASLDCGSALCLGPGTDRERRCPRPWGLRLSPGVQGWSTSAEQLGPPILLPRCVLLIANKASSSEQPPWPHRGSRGRRGAAASPARVCVRARVCVQEPRSAAAMGGAPCGGLDHFRFGRGAAKMADPGGASLPSRCPGRHLADGSSGGARRGREQRADGPTGGAGQGGTGPDHRGGRGSGWMGSVPLGAAVPGDPSPFPAVLMPRRGFEKRGRAENKSSARDTITQPILAPTRKFMSGTRVDEAAGCDPPAAAAPRAQPSPGAAVGSGCSPSPAARSGPRPGAAAAPRAAAHGARRGESCAA